MSKIIRIYLHAPSELGAGLREFNEEVEVKFSRGLTDTSIHEDLKTFFKEYFDCEALLESEVEPCPKHGRDHVSPFYGCTECEKEIWSD